MSGLLRLERATGVVDGVNVDFSCPTPYISGTLHHFLNGQLLHASLDNGLIEVSPGLGTFKLKIAPKGPNPGSPPAAMDPGDQVDVVYQSPLELTGGGLDGGVPDLKAAQNIIPKILAAPELHPKLAASEDLSAVKSPRVTAADNVAPDTRAAVDIKPKLISAREIP